MIEEYFDSQFQDLKNFTKSYINEIVKNQNTLKRKDYVFPSGGVFKMPDAVEYLNLSAAVIRRLCEEGKMKHWFFGKEYRFKRDDLDEFIKENFKYKAK